MAKLVQWDQYRQISTDDMNNMSKFIYNSLLKDMMRYTVSNVRSVLSGLFSGTIVQQNLGTDYNVQVSPFLGTNDDGDIILRTSSSIISLAAAVTNPRVDVIQAEQGYADSGSQTRQFIDPSTGNVSSSTTFTEFQIDAEITVVQGTEAASPVAPNAGSNAVKIAEVFVATSGGIQDDDIYNVDSKFGENNTGWTTQQARTVLLSPSHEHKINPVLDHPDGSVTQDKLSPGAKKNIRSFSVPVTYIPNGNNMVIHEVTVPTGKTLTINNWGVIIENGGSVTANVDIEAGVYSGGFTRQLSTNQRDNDPTVNNVFTAGEVVQFRLINTSGGDRSMAGHLIYTIS